MINIQWIGDTVAVRPISSEDFGLYASLYSNKRVMQYVTEAYTPSAVERYFKAELKLSNVTNSNRQTFVFYRLDTKESIGLVALIWGKEKKTATLGTLALPKKALKGQAFEAMNLVIEYAFSHPKLEFILGQFNSNNRAARMVTKKMGFIREAFDDTSENLDTYKLTRIRWNTL